MSIRLELFLLLLCFLFFIFLLRKIYYKKIEFKYSIPWFLTDFVFIIISLFNKQLLKVKDLFGFEVLSNMIFLFGFIMVLLLLFSCSVKLSIQSTKITKLTQELSILRKEFEDEKNNK